MSVDFAVSSKFSIALEHGSVEFAGVTGTNVRDTTRGAAIFATSKVADATGARCSTSRDGSLSDSGN